MHRGQASELGGCNRNFQVNLQLINKLLHQSYRPTTVGHKQCTTFFNAAPTPLTIMHHASAAGPACSARVSRHVTSR